MNLLPILQEFLSGVIFGGQATGYLDLTDLPRLIPVPVSVKPMEPILLTDRTVSLTAFDARMTTP
jgi:hypothetical protein